MAVMTMWIFSLYYSNESRKNNEFFFYSHTAKILFDC